MDCNFSNGSISSRIRKNDVLREKEKLNKEIKITLDKDSKLKTIGVDRLEKILDIYPDLNGCWLLTGIGNMIKSEKEYLLTEEERNASEPISEINYLKSMIRSKDEYIEKLQKEIVSYQKGNK